MAPTADRYSKILSDDSDSDTPEKCRKRRRRRIEMRRMRSASCQLFSSQFQPPSPRETRPQNPNYVFPTWKQCLKEKEMLPMKPPSAANKGLATPSALENPMPDFGCISIQGLSESMGDAWFVKENFCPPDIVGQKPLHFFAVYDGHGGSHVSRLCKKMMHTIMVEELTRVSISKTSATGNASSSSLAPQKERNEELEEEEWEDLVRVGLERSFQRMDQLALRTCACGETDDTCGCQQQRDIAFTGSTAVVALLTPDRIVVANCGDSRAVLCRDGRATPFSLDHKPERPDELQRLRAGGAKIVYGNGVRVYGILNMSHSLGDKMLKTLIIRSQPEISITEREAEDECLILGSHGIWDVVSDELACQVASKCLKQSSLARSCYSNISGRDDGAQVLFPSKTKFAAAILCRLALGRGSHDNVSVIVVNLRSGGLKVKGRQNR